MRRLLHLLAVGIFFSAATVLMTWPAALRPRTHLISPRTLQAFMGGSALLPTSPDTYLHLWIMAWVHHALSTAPTSLFDANIFYPARHALAGSEHMLGHWPVHAPVYAASGNPVLAYQWVLLSSFVLNAVAMYVLVRRWTGSAAAALVGGAIYAFAPLRFDLIGTVQHVNVAFLPLVVLLADHYRRSGRPAALIGVASATAIQALCSYYLAYVTAIAAGVLTAVGLAMGDGVARRRALALGGAAVVGLVPLAALSVPYLALHAAAVVPDYPEVWLRSAAATPGWFVRRDMALFLGYLPLGLAIAGVLGWRRVVGERWRLALALGLVVVGAVLTLGPTLRVAGRELPLPYRLLQELVPGFGSLRYPPRFGTLVLLGFAPLAAAGWARLVVGRRFAWPATALALLVIGLEYRQAPLDIVRVEVGEAVPPAYRWLAAHGAERPLLDWPVAPPGDMRAGYQHSRAMYFSTYDWLPLLNGYTAYEPPSHGVASLLALRLPEERAWRDLADLTGMRLLLLHRDQLTPDAKQRWTAWLADGGCERQTEFGADVICELPPPRQDLRAALVAANEGPPAHTFRGLPLAPLPVSARAGRLAVEGPLTAMAAGLVHRLRVSATNRGDASWPGLAPLVPGAMTLRYRWRADGGDSGTGTWTATPLLCDLPPGETCELVVPVLAPGEPGAYHLELALAQEEGPEVALDEGPLAVPVRVVALRGERNAR